jgi:hypothetical protein
MHKNVSAKDYALRKHSIWGDYLFFLEAHRGEMRRRDSTTTGSFSRI